MTVKELLMLLRIEQIIEFRENNWALCEMTSTSPAVSVYSDREIKDWFPYVHDSKLKLVINLRSVNSER